MMTERVRQVRVTTWNIHGCIGGDRRHDVERIGECVGAIAPDIAAFQEVDSRRKSPTQTDINGYLRGLVGDHGHEAWSITGADGQYGQILASRFPLEDREVHDISVPGREPRKVIEARISLADGSLRVIATHLGVRRGERRRQVRRLRDLVAADLSSPVLLLGDLNEWRRGHAARHAFSDLFDAVTDHASFPSRFPIFPLDRILCRPGSLLVRSWVYRAGAAASDHLPIVADLALSVAGEDL